MEKLKYQKWLEPKFSPLVVKGLVTGETTAVHCLLGPQIYTRSKREVTAPVTALEVECKNQEDF